MNGASGCWAKTKLDLVTFSVFQRPAIRRQEYSPNRDELAVAALYATDQTWVSIAAERKCRMKPQRGRPFSDQARIDTAADEIPFRESAGDRLRSAPYRPDIVGLLFSISCSFGFANFSLAFRFILRSSPFALFFGSKGAILDMQKLALGDLDGLPVSRTTVSDLDQMDEVPAIGARTLPLPEADKPCASTFDVD